MPFSPLQIDSLEATPWDHVKEEILRPSKIGKAKKENDPWRKSPKTFYSEVVDSLTSCGKVADHLRSPFPFALSHTPLPASLVP